MVAGNWNTMTATVAVIQVPSETHKIIIGQLHYDVDRPFVTLRYDKGTVNVIADRGASCTLLTGVALGQRFS
jgi:Alginate lyase